MKHEKLTACLDVFVNKRIYFHFAVYFMFVFMLPVFMQIIWWHSASTFAFFHPYEIFIELMVLMPIFISDIILTLIWLPLSRMFYISIKKNNADFCLQQIIAASFPHVGMYYT